MHDVLEQVDSFLDEPVEEDDGQELFDRVVNFIIELEPDSLSDDQLKEVMDILDHLEFEDIEEQKQTRRPKLAKKSTIKKKQYSRQYTRKNRSKIKRKRILLKRSAQGRKRKKLKKRMAQKFRTPTDRLKVRYHKTRGGQGGKRKKKKEENK
jgi:hypothetical protein